MSKRVVVLMGGQTRERSVSLDSGAACARGLREAGYEVSTLDTMGDPEMWIRELLAHAPDLVFNALHGPFGEDGKIQGFLETLRLPYTHSGTRASAVAMDKIMSKTLFRRAGLTIVPDCPVTFIDLKKDDPLRRPFVIKPVDEGSSVGVVIVQKGTNVDLRPLKEYDRLMAEAFVPGRELTVSCFKGTAQVVTELRPLEGFYDFEAKYTEGKTRHIVPAQVPEAIYEQALRDTEKAYAVLGCRGIARADFRYNPNAPAGQQLVILEINTQPGMTELSLVPEQANHLGINFPELVHLIAEDASCDR